MKRWIAKMVCGALLLAAVLTPEGVRAASVPEAGETAGGGASVQADIPLPPPVITNITCTTITVKQVEGYEYSMEGYYWRTSNEFTRLASDAEYTVYQRLIDQPETVSEPVSVRTLRRTDGTVPAVPPQIDHCTHNSITLVKQEGYEYRVNGGDWQAWIFEDLQPDTEYTFEQRVRLTQESLAGPVSEPVVFRTSFEGPSSRVNHQKVLDYVEANGVANEEGDKGVGAILEDGQGGYYYLILYANSENSGTYPAMQLIYDGTAVNGLVLDMDCILQPNLDVAHANYTTMVFDGDTQVDWVHSSVEVRKKEYRTGYDFTVWDSGTYITSQLQTQLGAAGMEMLCSFWDEVLYEELGFGLKGMGFTSYEGKGETFCDSATGYHLGTLETRFAREAGCMTDGSTGVKYCSVCGEIADAGKTIKAKGTHTYDNECDIDCNDCGQIRWSRHSYIHSCAQTCYVCGYVRDQALEPHTPGDACRCIHCGEEARRPGDVSGEGKLNMVDVSMIYAHCRKTAPLTDPVVLAAADVTGEGIVNMADVSKLYSIIRRKL